MNVSSLLLDLYDRIEPLAQNATNGLDADALLYRPGPRANSIAWLVWHSARIQDSHIAELLDADQLWETGTWAETFGLKADPHNTGFGHEANDVASVAPKSSEALLAYFHAVQTRTRSFLEGLIESDLDTIVDRRWNPPVTMGVRLVSVAGDCLQHLGQAAYVKGLLP